MTLYTDVTLVRAKLTGSSQYPISGTGVGTAADLADNQIAAEIDGAEAQINAALASRYVIPFAFPVPSLVRQLTSDIAAYLSDLSYRGGAARQYDSRLNPLFLRYERALGILERLRTGEADLPGGEVLPGDSESGGAFAVNPYKGELFDTDGSDVFGDPDSAREPRTTGGDQDRITWAPEWDLSDV